MRSLSVGAYGRLSRVNPNQDMLYKEWVIPAGVSTVHPATVQDLTRYSAPLGCLHSTFNGTPSSSPSQTSSGLSDGSPQEQRNDLINTSARLARAPVLALARIWLTRNCTPSSLPLFAGSQLSSSMTRLQRTLSRSMISLGVCGSMRRASWVCRSGGRRCTLAMPCTAGLVTGERGE
jgi:hypothetical protein